MKSGKVGTFPDEQIHVEGELRDYRLHVPKSLNHARPAPLLFAFHGAGDTPNNMAGYSQLDELADEQGFVVVYPKARQERWVVLPERAAGDIGLFDVLYTHLTKVYNIDVTRVYVVGISNGSYFANTLASERADKIAAIAIHSGGIGIFSTRKMDVPQKFAVMVIHGTADDIINVEEGRKASAAYKKWGHPVDYVEVPNLGHAWATDADVNHTMWKLFMAHPLPH